jgi:cobalt-zinc-cadmium efflux system membrane fusion protein
MKKYIVIMLSLLALSCKNETVSIPETAEDSGYITVTKAQFKNMEMEMGTPVLMDFDVAVKASGRIDVPPKNRAKITTFISGFVKSSNLLIGDKVTQGQALLTIESPEIVDMQKDYLTVARQIEYLKSEYTRQKTLYDEKITSQKNYLKADSDYKTALGQYQTLRQKLIMMKVNPGQVEKGKIVSSITLYAPISGDVTTVNAAVGMAVNPSDMLMEIVDNKELHVELSVFEKDILKVKENQLIKFTVPEASKEVFEGDVHLIGKSIEGEDRTTNVHGHLDEKVKQKLLTGMFIEANIIVDRKKGYAVPKDALGKENDKYFVLLYHHEDGKGIHFTKVPVKIEASSDDFQEISMEGKIKPESKIVLKGVYDLIE